MWLETLRFINWPRHADTRRSNTLECWVVLLFSHYVTASTPLQMLKIPSEHQRATREDAGTEQRGPRCIESSLIVAQPPPSSACYLKQNSHYTSDLIPVCPALALPLFRSRHSANHMVLIHSLHVTKPRQQSLIHYNCQLSFYSNTFTNLFVINSIYSSHSYQSKWTKESILTKIVGIYKSEMPGNSAGNYVTLHEFHSLLICNCVK